jgi:hypothetical protein
MGGEFMGHGQGAPNPQREEIVRAAMEPRHPVTGRVDPLADPEAFPRAPAADDAPGMERYIRSQSFFEKVQSTYVTTTNRAYLAIRGTGEFLTRHKDEALWAGAIGAIAARTVIRSAQARRQPDTLQRTGRRLRHKLHPGS